MCLRLCVNVSVCVILGACQSALTGLFDQDFVPNGCLQTVYSIKDVRRKQNSQVNTTSIYCSDFSYFTS
jgi:hypothetical protein